jgi:hypothetical protein
MNFRNVLFLAAFAIPVLLISCSDDDDDIIDKDPLDDLIIDSELCRVQKIINSRLENVFFYQYLLDYPELLDFYYEYEPLSGQIRESQKFIYGPASSGKVRVDTTFHYLGDLFLYGTNQFTTARTYHYTNYGSGNDRVDSVMVWIPTNIPEEPFGHKGTIYYEYDGETLLISEYYLDNPDYLPGTPNDNYDISYIYDDQGRLIEWAYFNYEDKMTYWEKYELTDYYQPNYRFTVIPQLAWANRFAPSKLNVPKYLNGGLTGSSDYSFRYQVNEKKYIVEKVVIYSHGEEEVLQLLTYECRDDD